jgi:Rad3-related DNA helicase
MYKSNLIIDEGHNVADHLIGRFGTNIWSIKAEQRKCPFPESFSNGEQFRNSIRVSADESIKWLRKYLDEVTSEYNASMLLSSKNDKLLASLKEEVTTITSVIQGLKTSPDTYLILFKESEVKQKTAEFKQFYGKKMKHLYIKPLKVGRLAQTVLWPEESVSKILFLSATFGQQDIDDLGLSDKRVGIFQCESPIPAQNREFRVFPVASMAYRNRQESVPRIALACMKIAEKHADEKGVIHCTYDIAKEIRNISTHSKHEKRLMFHTQQDKQEVYEAFRKSKKPVILVASGMSEGIDLKGDAARWQIITMLIKGSIEDDVNYYQMINNPELYDWKCARTVMQTAGRNCRDPLDIGHTYIIDSEFFNFYVKTHTNRIKAGKPSMWADWFLDAIVWSDRADRR